MVVDDGPTPERQSATVVQVEGGFWKVVRPGAVSADVLQRQAACLVVFVCTGNTCRSPMAECSARCGWRNGSAARRPTCRGRVVFHVYSAGLSAMTGGPAAEEAVDAARAYGADLTTHASRPLTADLAAQADYLVTMMRGHLTVLAERYRGLAARPRLLSPAGDDLADPVGCSRSVYEEFALSDLGLFGVVRRRTPSSRVQRLPEWLNSNWGFSSASGRPTLRTTARASPRVVS